MFKLIKYELKSTFLTIIGICITLIITNLLLMTRKGSWGINTVTALSLCLTIGAIIVIFISSLTIMSKYLYEDSGYLLFTLPQSGISIITSRLITALIQISIVIFVSLFMFYLNTANEISFNFLKNISASNILIFIIYYIWMTISTQIFIYFCMIMGKVALKGKKLGKIGSFIIFILLTIGISWIQLKVSTLCPQALNLRDFSIATTYKISTSTSGFSISGGAGNVNIAITIFDIITFAGFFITSSYLIDNKLDLS